MLKYFKASILLNFELMYIVVFFDVRSWLVSEGLTIEQKRHITPQVDFAAPVGYEEPQSIKKQANEDEMEVDISKYIDTNKFQVHTSLTPCPLHMPQNLNFLP